jgi:hypothetical protein
MAPSRPAIVKGNMRPPKSSRINLIDGVYPQWLAGTGLSHTQCS